MNVAHSEALLEARGNRTAPQSIAAVLTAPRARATVVWTDGGHEVFQTCKRSMKRLLHQLAVGFHDVNDVDAAAMPALLGAAGTDGHGTVGGGASKPPAPGKRLSVPGRPDGGGGGGGGVGGGGGFSHLPLEDRYLDKIAATTAAAGLGTRPPTTAVPGGGGARRATQHPDRAAAVAQLPVGPAATALSLTLGASSVHAKEYMQWRQRRNAKRLARFDGAVIMIQRAYRSHIARNLTVRVKHHRSALIMQRWWRGVLARAVLASLREQDWAARLLQRLWRGYSGRMIIWRMFLQRKAAVVIQRCWRGAVSRSWVKLLRKARWNAAVRIQNAFRAYLYVWLLVVVGDHGCASAAPGHRRGLGAALGSGWAAGWVGGWLGGWVGGWLGDCWVGGWVGGWVGWLGGVAGWVAGWVATHLKCSHACLPIVSFLFLQCPHPGVSYARAANRGHQHPARVQGPVWPAARCPGAGAILVFPLPNPGH